MCLICIELTKGKLTATEALANLKETMENITEDHFVEVLEVIWDKQQEEKQ